MLSASCKVLVITAACLVSGAKLRHQGLASPFLATQEINRCLSVLRAASSSNATGGTNRRRSNGVAILVK
jgi:hypothetical protein